MKRLVLFAAFFSVLLLAWFLRANDQARTARSADDRHAGLAATAPTPRPNDGNALDDPSEVARPERSDTALISGRVVSPSGPVWGATIRVYRRGDSVAFDETGTKPDGTYQFEVSVGVGGTSLDLSGTPDSNAALSGERFDNIQVRRGETIQQDFLFTTWPVIEGSIVFERRSRGSVRVGLVHLADWSALLAATGGAYPVDADFKFVAVMSTREKFRFAQIPRGRYVVTCESRYAVALDPPVVEPGDTNVVVETTRLESLQVVALDAVTHRPVELASVRILGFSSAIPFTGASGKGVGFPVRLRATGPEPGMTAGIRVSSAGYHDHVRRAGSTVPIKYLSGVALVPTNAPVLTIRLDGAGSAEFIENLTVSAHAYAERFASKNAGLSKLSLPILEANPRLVRMAIPIGRWSLRFPSAQAHLGGASGLIVEVPNARDVEIAVKIPASATIRVAWPDPEDTKSSAIWLAGGQVKWVPGADDVFRLTQDRGKPTTVAIYKYQWNDPASSAPQTFRVFPGAWDIVRRPLKGELERTSVDLTPGARVTVAFGR